VGILSHLWQKKSRIFNELDGQLQVKSQRVRALAEARCRAAARA
jgi:hypothetical protein